MPPLLLVFLIVLGFVLYRTLRNTPARRHEILRRASTAIIIAVSLLLSLRLRQYWISALSLVWLLVERRIFRLPASASGAPGGAGDPTGHARQPSRESMSRAEALNVLGLEEGATREQIVSAYRNLMKRVHPDTGGSDYLARKLNQAKDVLTS
jgi:hypothetical protein